MRDEPVLVDRVAVKAAAQLVVHAAFFHCEQSLDDHVAGVVTAGSLPVAKQEIMHGRAWKFRGRTEAPQRGIERTPELVKRGVRYRNINMIRARFRRACLLAELLHD